MSIKRGWAIAVLTTLVLVPAASSSCQPLVTLGTITLANGTAAVSGTLASQAAGSQVTVNGQPLAVNSSGTFAGTADLNGAQAIDLGISNPGTVNGVEPSARLGKAAHSASSSLLTAGRCR